MFISSVRLSCLVDVARSTPSQNPSLITLSLSLSLSLFFWTKLRLNIPLTSSIHPSSIFSFFRRARRAAEPAARGPGGLAQRGPLLGSAAQDAPSPGHQLQDLHQVSQSVSQSTTHHLTVGDKNAAATSAGEVGEVFPSSLSASASPPSACAIAAPPKFLFLYPLRSPFLPSILSRPLDGQAY